MDQNIKELIDPFIESAGNLGASLGISKVVTQLYALLYLSPDPLSMDDMCDFLKISKGNVCTNLKYLEQWEAVKKIWVKGSRKDYYEANRDIVRIIRNRLKEGLNRRLGNFMQQIDGLEKTLSEKKIDSKTADTYKKRIEEVRNLNNMINKAFALSETFIK
jgi:DNA-binding transcriptional regulator GbsR (MarR family)